MERGDARTVTAEQGPRPGPLSGWAWWWIPLAVFAASRVVSSVMLLLAGPDQIPVTGEEEHFPRDPSFADLLSTWDGRWYRVIATDGYPTDLPREGDAVVKNVWAFYPLVPGLARLLMLGGLGHVWAASTVAMVTSAAACVVLFAMVRERSDDFTAALAVATLVLGPIGAVFQTTYTEGSALLLVLLTLRALGARQWGRVVAYGLLLAFTRPITLALAAVCGLTWVLLWWRRDTEPFPSRDRVRLAATTVVLALSFLAWPAIAGIATGERDAYRTTQAAWLHPEAVWTTWLSGAGRARLVPGRADRHRHDGARGVGGGPT
ncbi:hypothetical protein SAMN04489844_4294 [Nocardioides exalbidus]|uniref:Dolichyl-phosphate-mannose-protein mannosyltransferase n=1 Tax=Nocardioides exalbidus TaxID=402596 RepID=A0A1H5A6M4_9ACTN|nr:hypothetical protein [Nocardioides exalbidus]SED38033.1 hypothetical protein SAMN04489844_4294 [Nocardioides exalbidus]